MSGIEASDRSTETGVSAITLRRRRIEEQLATIEADAVTAVGGIGFGKRIGEGTNIAVERLVEVAIHDSLQTELETVRRAEQKLSSDRAGLCDECGIAIPAERLEALPWAVTCVGCASS